MYEPSKVNAVQMHKMCLRKSRFTNERYAKKVAKAKEIQYNCKNTVYFCPLCGGWHITTIKEKKNEKHEVQ